MLLSFDKDPRVCLRCSEIYSNSEMHQREIDTSIEAGYSRDNGRIVDAKASDRPVVS